MRLLGVEFQFAFATKARSLIPDGSVWFLAEDQDVESR